MPSHASMFTGLYPDEHGAGHPTTTTPLGPEPETLAEVLRNNGYQTVAFTGGGILSAANGLARGFNWWIQHTRANLRSVLPGFFDAIGTHPTKPLFLFLHTYDIHGPNAYLPGLDERFGVGKSGQESLRQKPEQPAAPPDQEWERAKSIGYHRYHHLGRFEGFADVRDAYDMGVRFVDGELERLFARLKRLGIYDRMIIIVTSDHGESLYESGLYLGHSYSLHDREIRVPLMVRFPGATRVGRSAMPVSLVDLMPLLLDEINVGNETQRQPNPLRQLDTYHADPNGDGRVIRGEAAHTGARYARDGFRVWIGSAYPRGDERSCLPGALRDRFDFQEQLYDLRNDPEESRNLLGSEEVRLSQKMRQLRDAGLLQPIPGAGDDEAVELDPQTIRELKELGYLQ
ncbi:MAG: sulfatase [bacterium]|nr:sulfatase [bacterium]